MMLGYVFKSYCSKKFDQFIHSKYLYTTLVFVILSWGFTDQVYISNFELQDMALLSKQYSWITEHRYKTIKYYCLKKKVYFRLALALVQSESNGKSWAISSANARGLFQIMPFHHDGPTKALHNDTLNIYYGVNYFKICLDKSKGDFKKAIAYYNAGHNIKLWKYNNYKYVADILNNYIISKQYERILPILGKRNKLYHIKITNN